MPLAVIVRINCLKAPQEDVVAASHCGQRGRHRIVAIDVRQVPEFIWQRLVTLVRGGFVDYSGPIGDISAG